MHCNRQICEPLVLVTVGLRIVITSRINTPNFDHLLMDGIYSHLVHIQCSVNFLIQREGVGG